MVFTTGNHFVHSSFDFSAVRWEVFLFNRKGPKGIAMGRKGRIDRNKLPQDNVGTAHGNLKFDL